MPAIKKKTKKTEEITRKDRASLLAAELNSMFKGRAEICTGKQFSNVFKLRRPTGIVSLDIAIGGGFPAGGISQLIGRDGSTKTYITNLVISNVQKTYGEDACIALCMTEMPYDKEFAKYYCGVRIAYSEEEIAMGEAAIGRKYTKEELEFLRDQEGTIHHVVGGTAEVILETAAKMIESNIYQVIVIDSFGALLTKAESEAKGGLEDKHYGGAATVITQFMHRLHAGLNMKDCNGLNNTTTVLGINQYRDNIGGSLYASPMKIAGGNALRHGKLVDLKLSGGAKIAVNTGSGAKSKRVIGKEINWDVIKGKAGCHDGPKGSFVFNFESGNRPFGADILADLILTGVHYGLIEQAGAWLTIRDGEGKEVLKGQGLNKLIVEIENQPLLIKSLRKDIFNKADLHFVEKEGEL